MDTIKLLRAAEAKVITDDWGSLTWYANRALGNSDDMTVGRCVLKPGMANPFHYHTNCSEVLVVTQGCVRHTMGEGKTVDLGVGDTISVPPLVKHQARNIGDGEAVLFIAFSSADRDARGE